MVSPVSSPGKAVVTPAAEARIIYVSTTGDDANDGLSPDSPVRTITRGEQLVRDSSPDWLLLKRGDQWQVGLDDWHKRGRSAEQPMIIGAYGTGPRPLLKSPNAFAPEQGLDFVSVIGVQFVAEARARASASTAAASAAAAFATRWSRPVPGVVRRAGESGFVPGDPARPVTKVPPTRPQPGHWSDQTSPMPSNPDLVARGPGPADRTPPAGTPPVSIPAVSIPAVSIPAASIPAPSLNRIFADGESLTRPLPSPGEALRPTRPKTGAVVKADRGRSTASGEQRIELATIASLAPLSVRMHPATKPRPLRVRRIALRRDDSALTVYFSGNVSGGTQSGDLVLLGRDGSTVDSSAMRVSIAEDGRSATWSFPGLAGAVLPAGRWSITLRGCITDDLGQQLDGRGDGIGGDDYVSPQTVLSHGSCNLATPARPHVEAIPRRAAA